MTTTVPKATIVSRATTVPRLPRSLEDALEQMSNWRREAHKQLRTWRWVYYVIGLIAVAAAAAAGFAGLADLVSAQVAGAIAFGSAVFGAADKFLGAGGKVEKLASACGSLEDEYMWLRTTIQHGLDQQDRIGELEAEVRESAGTPHAEVLRKELNEAKATFKQWWDRELAAVHDYIEKHPHLD